MNVTISLSVLCSLFVFLSSIGNAQETKPDFPSNWLGKWSGDLTVFQGYDKVRTIPMSLTIDEIEGKDTLVYRLQYGETDIRDYRMFWVDKKKGQLSIDERNSIVIPSYIHGPVLTSLFTVQSTQILTMLERVGNTLRFRILASNIEDPYISGLGVIGLDTIPEVKTQKVSVFQEAILKQD